MGRIRGGSGVLVALVALTAGVATATTAVAGAPTRVDDTVTAAYVDAVNADRQLDIAVFHSAEAGVQAFASLSGGPEGNHLADGGARPNGPARPSGPPSNCTMTTARPPAP